MWNDPEKQAENEPVEVRCYFVRERNALVVRGQFTPIYTDYYLHLMQHRIRYREEQDRVLKDGFAALTLHLASRPWNEAIAWTLSWQDPRQNVFLTGSNRQGNVTGRIFTEDVRAREENLFHSQVTVDGQPDRRSMIEADSLDFFRIGEDYYDQSEQREGRFFHLGDEDFVLVTSQPDCDLPWLGGLDEGAVREMDQAEELSLLEKRHYRFDCGCSQDKLFPIIAGMSGDTIDEVFGDDEIVPAGCPRCGAKYVITREALEAFVEKNR